MKDFLNRILSSYTEYDLNSLIATIKNKVSSFFKTAKYYLVDKVNEIFSKYPIYVTVILAILAIIFLPTVLETIFSIAFFVVILVLIYKYFNFKKDQFYLNYDTSNVGTELDNFIKECLTEYVTFNGYQEVSYLSSEDEDKLKEELVNMVSARLSDRLFKRLCIAYKESAVYDIIAIHIATIVMGYVIETNRQQDLDKINNGEVDDDGQMSTIPFLLRDKNNIQL